MRALRFHDYGNPLDVLHLEDAELPEPGEGQIRVSVQACGLTPADWALCGGLFAGTLPRGVGLEVSGTVTAVGSGVSSVLIGESVFGPALFTGPTAGASEQALLDTWFARPATLDPVDAAALPMAVETAYRGLDELGVREGTTVLVHGAGSTVGFAAVQIAVQRGACVIATSGATYADRLRDIGAEVTAYGDGMVERVLKIAGSRVDLVLDAAPVNSSLPDLVRTVDEPGDVLTLSDFTAAGQLGVRVSAGTATALRHDVLGEYATLAADGRFSIPVAGVFGLEDWRTAVQLSQSGRARGKLVLQIR